MNNHPLTSSDKELFEALRQGDRKAFAVLYEKYWYRLFLVAYHRLKQKEPAEELVQDLFVNLWKKKDSIQVTHVENYLFKAIRFAIIDHIRNRMVKDKYIEYYKAFVSLEDSGTEDLLAGHDLSAAIDKGLNTLPEKSRTVFQLSRFESWPVSKIAHHLHLSEKAVEYHLTKSLKTLRIYLKEFILSVLLFGFWR